MTDLYNQKTTTGYGVLGRTQSNRVFLFVFRPGVVGYCDLLALCNRERLPGIDMEHFAPHSGATFEGYYSKFILPSGASLCLIVCSVHQADNRPHMVSFTYVPADPAQKIYQKEIFPEKGTMTFVAAKERNSFELKVDQLGYVKVSPDSTTEYNLTCPEWTFRATTITRVPWSSNTSTPESWLVYLPLPLHWHVHSLASKCNFDLQIPKGAHLDAQDEHGVTTVHQEKVGVLVV